MATIVHVTVLGQVFCSDCYSSQSTKWEAGTWTEKGIIKVHHISYAYNLFFNFFLFFKLNLKGI